jgi:hypothetical protein
MKPKLFTVHWILFTVLLAAASLHAQVPKLINYQGKLVRDGKLANGPVTLVFAIYADQDGGNPLWSQEKQLTVQNGIFNVPLGDETPAFDTLFTGTGKRWLEVRERDKPRLGQRAQITSVAYALKANSANALDAPDGIPTDAVFVDNSGNVGIGTTSPTTKLTIGDGSGTATMNFVGKDNTVDIGVRIEQKNSLKWLIGMNNAVQDSSFSILQGGASDRLVIDTNGNVGIGTTSPSAKLEVRGNLSLDSGGNPNLFTGNGVDELNRYLTLINSPARTSASGLKAGGILVSDDYSFANPGKNDLIVKGNIFYGGRIEQLSSREFKENVADLSLQEAMAAFEDLRPVKFKYKTDEQKDLHVGFIAEEVPELLATPDHKGVNPMDVVAVLTKVVQEQQKTIAELQNRVKSLEEWQ